MATCDALRPAGRGHLLPMPGLSEDLEVGLGAKHRHEPFANHLVVVDDQDADAHGHQARTGIRTRIASPLSSPLRTSKVPPRSSTWRRLRFIPKCVPLSW